VSAKILFMNITFIRHSKTKIEPEKPIVLRGLADEGIEKAQALSKDQAIKQLDVVYSSLQTKAIETMLYLAKPNALAAYSARQQNSRRVR
jgi:broad specificity phosphatase PhoE